MSHFVYIIYSSSVDAYYKGETGTPEKRLEEHNANLSRYTAGKGPWIMVYLEELEDRTGALKREKMLKRQNRKYIEWLLEQPINKIQRMPPRHGLG
jgi:putative endonuclease